MNWLTTKEACEYLKVGRSTLMGLKGEGTVKAFPLFRGKKKAKPILRWREEDLDAVLMRPKRRRMGRIPDAKRIHPKIEGDNVLVHSP